jgi:hypothetical protein
MAGTFSYRSALIKAFAGAFGDALSAPTTQGGPGATNQQLLAESAFAAGRRRIVVPVTDGGTAATAALESPILWAESWLTGTSSGTGALAVVGVEFLPQISVAIGATNYYTLTIAVRTSGGAATTIASITSNTGGTATTAFTAVAMTAGTNGFPYVLNANTDVLTMALTKTGSGAAIGSATGACYVQIILDEM